jgi:tRNA pseudouridine38-40 synthase
VRLRLDLAYDGARFHGWAVQPGLRTVQGEVESALAKILGLDAALTCAGRTDTGVHARGQVAHVDVGDGLDVASLERRLSRLLPGDIRLQAVTEAPDGFDARFSAMERRYAYRLHDHGAGDPLTRGHIVDWPRELDIDAMTAAAEPLLGEHDFAAFCRPRQGASTIRDLRAFHWQRAEGGLAVATVTADAFCHNQVRSLVGALLAVGDGRRPVAWPTQVLAGRRRVSDVGVVPPHGLTLEEIGYAPDGQLADRATASRRMRPPPDTP